MAATSLSDWDARHRAAEGAGAEPAEFVQELLPLLPRGRALDLACGTGRHTLLLAGRHQHVTAVDGSRVALETLEKRARAAGLTAAHSEGLEPSVSAHARIQLANTDLEHVTLPGNSFALILCVHYLQRSLFPQIERALTRGGMLLFETFTRAQLEFPGGPKDPEHLLESGELHGAFPGLRLLVYRELRAGKGIASLLAQKPHSSDGHVQ
jgi:tellurite methyltransferase